MIDTATALEASATWERIGRALPILEAALEPGRNGETTTRTPPRSKAPLTWWIHDLIEELDTAIDFYVSALLMETHHVKRAPATLPERIQLIATYHGHFTTNDDYRMVKDREGNRTIKHRIALDYCDEAEGFWTRIEHILRQPAQPRFMGPCLTNCGGDMYLHPGRLAATCVRCASEADLAAIKDQLRSAFASRTFTRDELRTALKVCQKPVKPNTLNQWVARKRLVPLITDPIELFRFADAAELAGVEVAS